MKNDIFILCIFDEYDIRSIRGLGGPILSRFLLRLHCYVILQVDALISFETTKHTCFLLEVVAVAAPLAGVGA